MTDEIDPVTPRTEDEDYTGATAEEWRMIEHMEDVIDEMDGMMSVLAEPGKEDELGVPARCHFTVTESDPDFGELARRLEDTGWALTDWDVPSENELDVMEAKKESDADPLGGMSSDFRPGMCWTMRNKQP